MVSKAKVQEFTQSWNKTVDWAKQNNIPYSAYYPVYQLDSQKFLSGSSMSEAERIRAIQAAQGLNYSTALPTDNPNWKDLRGNTVRNAQDIFTGLTGVQDVSPAGVVNTLKGHPSQIVSGGILGSLWDTVKSTVEHPSDIYNAVGDLVTGNPGAAANEILKKDNILQLVPGVYDLAKVFSADPHLQNASGLEALADNPITSVLDIVPFGRVASEGLGRTAIGKAAADRIGLSPEELRKAGIWRVGGKLIKTKPIGGILSRIDHPLLDSTTDPETGLSTPSDKSTLSADGSWQYTPTLGDMWEFYKNKVGAGAQQADIGESALRTTTEGTKQVEERYGPVAEALKTVRRTLGPEGISQFNKWMQTDFRPISDKMADDRIPLPLRNAAQAAHDFAHMHNQIEMLAGKAKSFPTLKDENGKTIYETYHVDTPQYTAVSRDLEAAEKAEAAVQSAAKPFMQILYKMDENDRNIQGVFAVMSQLRSQVNESIKRSIPQETNANVTERLRNTLPGGERWDRAVADQTPLIRNLLGLHPSDKLTLFQVNIIRDLFSDHGLLDQAVQAYRNQDWVQLNKVTKAAVRKFNSKTLSSIPKDGRAILHKTASITKNLQRYAAERQRQAESVNKMATGYYRGARMAKGKYQQSLAHLTQTAAKAHQKFLQTAIHNPPDLWRNVGMDMYSSSLAQADKTAMAMEDFTKALSAQNWQDSEITKIHQDTRTIQELMTNAAKSSLENNMLPDIDHAESARVTEDMYKNLASLRARGFAPLWVHMNSPHIAEREPTYNVYMGSIRPRKMSSSHARTQGFTSSVYDVGAGLLQAAKDQVERDMVNKFIDQEVMPRLHPAADIQSTVRNYYSAEIAENAERIAAGEPRIQNSLTIIERGLEAFNLESFKPNSVFGEGFSHPKLSGDGEYYIDKDLARAFKQTLTKYQFPAQSIIDRGTKVFRFSILGLSPRYTAHILFGGSYLIALRAHPGMFKFMGQAVHFAVHNSFSDKTLQRFPDITELEGTTATQEGLAQSQYHYVAMNSAGRNWLIPEWLNKRLLDDTYKNRIRAAANINMRFTHAIVRAQKAMVYLDAADRASKTGKMFYDDISTPRTDDQGNPILHPVTGRQLHDTVRSKIPMTAAQTHHLGMEAVADVMGNLRHMTPLERSLLTRVFPFYGWTKHILQYVMSYPFDHPYRAMVLSQIATQNSEDVATGLPLRIQLLTMLGNPDQMGNVTAIDTKAMNPLRDTANYMSLTGLFESLNPAILGVGSLVDPQISFGGQNLYPQVTFNSLYGVSTAGAGGSLYTAAEQFVPQISAVDVAFNLSGQYAYLAKSNPTAFSKKVFESLGLPFTPEQLNLRQIAAKQEIARYKIASNAAYEFASGQNPNALAGYPATAQLPDPLNASYNVSPAYLAAMEQTSESQTGLPFTETATPPPTPAL